MENQASPNLLAEISKEICLLQRLDDGTCMGSISKAWVVAEYIKKYHRKEEEGDLTLTTDDLSEQLLRRVSKKRHTPHEELVEDDSHRPPVHWLPIALSQDHLGSNIFRCSTHL